MIELMLMILGKIAEKVQKILSMPQDAASNGLID